LICLSRKQNSQQSLQQQNGVKAMSKVIQVLAQMGSDAIFQSEQSEEAITSLLAATELDTEITEAITTKDIISLERQLDVCPDVVCFILPAEDDEEEKDDDKDEDSTEETSHRVIGF